MSDAFWLKAGAAEVDVTPALDIQIAGDIGRRRPVEEIRERIYSRALFLEGAGQRCCILSIEVCFITDRYVAEIRRRAAEEFGLEPHAILVHPVQNHSAPAVGNAAVSDEYAGIPPDLWWLRSGDERYNEPAIQGILESMRRAHASMVPVQVFVAREIDGRPAFNRRFVLRDGTAVAHPGGQFHKMILFPEGPIDPEVGVMVLRAADGRNVAALLHYTCHPVHGYPHRYVMGDWPGAWASAMRSALGIECIPLVINGCCGNVHHHNHLDPTHVSNHMRMGAMLAESAGRALRELQEQRTPRLAWRSEVLQIPVRELDAEEVSAARALLERQPQAPITMEGSLPSVAWDWVYAHAIMDLAAKRQRRKAEAYEVQAIRIADTGIVALVGEPFVEGQLDIKQRSPFPFTWVAHMANGYAGYVPTPEALRRGGNISFETRTSNWSQFVPEALEMIANKALALLNDLHRQP